MKRLNKKGQSFEVLSFSIIIIIFLVSIILGNYVYSKFTSAMDDTGLVSVENMDKVKQFDGAWTLIDNSVVFVVFGLMAWVVVTSWMVNSYPMLAPINLVILAFVVFTSFILSNLYKEITDVAELSSTAANYSMVPYVAQYLPFICIALGIVSIIVMYSKRGAY